jgi:hypothetical protein
MELKYEKFLRKIHDTGRNKDSLGADADIMNGLMGAESDYNEAKENGKNIEEATAIYREKLGAVKIYIKRAIEVLQAEHQELSEQLQECKDNLLDDDLNVDKIFEIIDAVTEIANLVY